MLIIKRWKKTGSRKTKRLDNHRRTQETALSSAVAAAYHQVAAGSP